MALDVKTVQAVRKELSAKLTGGRIEKVQQPEKDLLLLTVRSEGTNYRLLIRAAGPYSRIHLTRQSYENPSAAPMFCMLLRKYLTGSRIQTVEQPHGDRVITFSLEGRNELGDRADLLLSVELMGRAANLILVDTDGRILDCLRRIPPSEYGGRALLPGLHYELPEQPEHFQSMLDTPQKDPEETTLSISELLDAKYGRQEQQELQRRRAQELIKTVRRTRDRQQRKLAAQTEELQRTERIEEIRRQAELLQANLYRVRRGDRILSCENYFDEKCPMVEIALDPLKTPQQNMNARFREYRKMKGAKEHLTVLLADGEKLLDYYNSVLDELERAASERDLNEIRRELEESGLLKGQKRKKTKTEKPAAPLCFESPDGMEILVGRNNVQNDELTTKLARRTDYWFHVKTMHGSHVILRCDGQEPSEQSVQYAARIAARYSQAADSGRTAVDYTMVRNVRKPAGALPGKVIYTNYRTIIVDSDIPASEGERH